MEAISIQQLNISECYLVNNNESYNELINDLLRRWEKVHRIKNIADLVIQKIKYAIKENNSPDSLRDMFEVITYCKVNMPEDNPAILILYEKPEIGIVSKVMSKYLVTKGFRIFEIPIKTMKLKKVSETNEELTDSLIDYYIYVNEFISRVNAKKIGIIEINNKINCEEYINKSSTLIQTIYSVESDFSCMKGYKKILCALPKIKRYFHKTLR